MPNPRSENFIVTVGVSYLGGSALGLAGGVIEGAVRGRDLPGIRLKLNSILNASGRRGSRAGNAMACLGP